MTNGKSAAISGSRRAELESLHLLESASEIHEAVSRIATTFGNVHSVIPIALPKGDAAAEYAFTINFENTLDAMTAARELKGCLYGFSALVVKIRKKGNGQAQ